VIRIEYKKTPETGRTKGKFFEWAERPNQIRKRRNKITQRKNKPDVYLNLEAENRGAQRRGESLTRSFEPDRTALNNAGFPSVLR
jgi:hypothetical protein